MNYLNVRFSLKGIIRDRFESYLEEKGLKMSEVCKVALTQFLDREEIRKY